MQITSLPFSAKIFSLFQAVRQHFAADHEANALAFAEGYEAGPHAVNPHRRGSVAFQRWDAGNKSDYGN